MSQCVPSWDLDEAPPPLRLTHRDNSNTSHSNPASLDYEVAELTWENGQLSMHGLVPPRVVNKHLVTSTWEKPISSGGTLESIVNQANYQIDAKSARGAHELVPWFNNNRALINPAVSSGGPGLTMDALVPCNNQDSTQVLESARTHMAGCSTGVGSCTPVDGRGGRMARVSMSGCQTNVSLSVSESATCGGRTLDTCEFGTAGLSSTSPENTSSGKEYTKTSGDDHDSVCHSRSQRKGGDEEGKKKGILGKSSVSTKRSRAAAIHNQSERKRRDKINQKMKTLQKMVPNSSKTDKASMLDEVIEYLKQLQAQVHMMNRMNMAAAQPMMLPLAMQQQQLQMSMMGMQMAAGMGGMGGLGAMGMGMGVMDINRANMQTVMPSAAAFMPIPAWDQNTADRLPATTPAVMPDPLINTFLASQSQAMPMDYARLAAMYHQFQQNPGSGPKN